MDHVSSMIPLNLKFKKVLNVAQNFERIFAVEFDCRFVDGCLNRFADEKIIDVDENQNFSLFILEDVKLRVERNEAELLYD